MPEALVAGVDFGTDSVRVSVWDVDARQHLMTVSSTYERWAQGRYCRPEASQFRQHPLDHLQALESCFQQIAGEVGEGRISALAVDSTGSTPAPTDGRGVPLALLPEHADDPDCMFWLWKDHTSSVEAADIDTALRGDASDFSIFQGTYSSEWWWAKILRAARTSEAVRAHAVSWVEHSDWIANLLVGRHVISEFSRNACAAGHKALYNSSLGGMVPESILAGLHPMLVEVARTFRLPPDVAGAPLGTVTPEWAARLRLGEGTIVGVGSIDAHAGAVGAGISPGTLVKVMGTSTVDMFLTDYASIDGKDIRAVCGVAEDSIIPGHLGGEAGQAAFGDLLAWYARLISWPGPADDSLLVELEGAAHARGPSGIVALDWINGRRYPNIDDQASAALLNVRIGHDAVDVYRALVDAAVLGSKAIFEGIKDFASIERVVLVGGVARKSALICQAMADAFDMEVMVCREDETCAKGAAMFAAVAAGYFPSIKEAQQGLCDPYSADFAPNAAGVEEFSRAFALYERAGELETRWRSR